MKSSIPISFTKKKNAKKKKKKKKNEKKKKKKKKIKSCGPRIDAYGSPNSMSGQLL